MALSDWGFIILLVVIAFVALFTIPQLLVRRAIPAVIRIFRKYNAVRISNAKTLNELKLQPKDMIQRMFGRRDYNLYALQNLMQAEVVKSTEDGKLYLSEEKLATSKWNKY